MIATSMVACKMVVCMSCTIKDLRHVQRRTKCNEKTILDFITTFEKHLGCPLGGNLRACDKKTQVHEQAMSAFVFVFMTDRCFNYRQKLVSNF